MRKYNFTVACFATALFLLLASSCKTSNMGQNNQDTNKQLIELANSLDTVSYSLGINIGHNLTNSFKSFPGEALNLDLLLKAFNSVMTNDTANIAMTEQESESNIQNYIRSIQEAEAKQQKEEQEAFLNANKIKEGVITTESNLQYKVLKEGEGKVAKLDNQVKVHYTGKLLDGTVFDSSVERGEPVIFSLNQVIKGWTEVLQLMNAGSKYQVWVPSDLAYGQQGAGDRIKPNSALEFEIELIEIIDTENETE